MKRCLVCGSHHAEARWRCPVCGTLPASTDGFLRFVPDAVEHRGDATDADYLLADLTAAEAWHFWFQARRQLVTWALRRFFGEARRLLDVGCGTGFVLEGLQHEAQLELSGCDPLVTMLTIAQRRVPAAFLFQAEATRLPFDQEFDAILALDVLEHIDADQEALDGIRASLKPGGGLVVTVPQHPSLWSAVDEFSHHRRRYGRVELQRKVRAAGFEIVRCTSCFTLTLPFVAASRWARRHTATFDPAAELRIPRAANAVLHALLECERGLIKAGVSLPAGSSLLLVARRPNY